MDTTFPRAYECHELTEAPGCESFAHYYYPGASTQGGRDGILVEVCPSGDPSWLGTFAFGQITPNGASGIFAMPDPSALCVVAKGEGYIVRASAPKSWESVRATPVTDVRPVRARQIVVFADFTRLVAYGQAGIQWETKRLSWDGLKITEVTDTVLKGEFFDFRSDTIASFVVDLATGAHRGGIDEP